MKFIQHFPPDMEVTLAIQGIKRVEFEFRSLRDFLANEHIQRYIKDVNFRRFTICRSGSEYELISELKGEGGRTFKVGVLDGDMRDVPEWCGKKVGAANDEI